MQHRLRMLAALVAAGAAAAIAAQAAPAAPPPAPPASGKTVVNPIAPGNSGQRLAPSTLTSPECPTGLRCELDPAAYAQNSSDPGDYGNFDLASRPSHGLGVDYVVIHDTESSFGSTLNEFENPFAYVSAHYVVRSSDGLVAQMVPTSDVAWHAGNWYVNTHAVGIENEGYATDPSYFTDSLYQSLARLTRYVADKYGVPLDRMHLIGHDQVPGPTALYQAGMHWDPGPYFDWARFMSLVGAPIVPSGDGTGRIVTIDSSFQTNRPIVTYCQGGSCSQLPSRPANFVYLYTAPSLDAPLVSDPELAGTSLEPNRVGTTQANDWGDKAVTGQSFAVVGRQGDWTAIWYGGQKAWLYGPPTALTTIPGGGTLITPSAGLASIPVYGRAYPSSVSTATLGYSIPAGQMYVSTGTVGADYYSATTYNAPSTYDVYKSDSERFYQISFNHRIAFVRASDVQVVG
jgi:N-acetylmuramoyl-L-alanine amidase